jgi:hypothetical protein
MRAASLDVRSFETSSLLLIIEWAQASLCVSGVTFRKDRQTPRGRILSRVASRDVESSNADDETDVVTVLRQRWAGENSPPLCEHG